VIKHYKIREKFEVFIALDQDVFGYPDRDSTWCWAVIECLILTDMLTMDELYDISERQNHKGKIRSNPYTAVLWDIGTALKAGRNK